MTSTCKGRRLTKQRKMILDEMAKVYTHPTAEEIYEMVSDKMPKISLATVYRNLEALEEDGQVIKLNVKAGNGKSRYDAHMEPHHHLVCKSCGCVEDIHDCCCEIKSKALEKSGFTISTYYLEIPGICKKCKN